MKRETYLKYRDFCSKTINYTIKWAIVGVIISFILINIKDYLTYGQFNSLNIIRTLNISLFVLGTYISIEIKTLQLKLIDKFIKHNKKYLITEGYMYHYLALLNQYSLAIASTTIAVSSLIFMFWYFGGANAICIAISIFVSFATLILLYAGKLAFNLKADIKLTQIINVDEL